MNMIPYKDSIHRMMTTLRSTDPGLKMLQSFRNSIAQNSIQICHVDHPGDAGVLMGADGAIYWYYNLGAVAAHAALLQTTGDDLTHEQRDACAAFDLLNNCQHSIAEGQVLANDRLDLDYARRSFRNELMSDPAGGMGSGLAATADAVRV